MRNDKKIVNDVASLTSALAGITTDTLIGKSRSKEVVMARMAYGNFLLMEIGIHYTKLEELTNRDRCSYYYYERKHLDNYKYWKEYQELYDKLRISYFGNSEDINITPEDLSKVIKENNISDNSASAVFCIDFKVGNAITKVYSKELTHTIQKLKETFIDYDFTFNVKHVNTLRYE